MKYRIAILTLSLIGILSGLAFAADERPLREVIDQQMTTAWQREQITPAPMTTDAEFIRRVSLDLVGCIPSHSEVLAFLADGAKDKRAQLIDRLLNDPRYGQHMADLWDVMLFGRNPPGYDTDKRTGMQNWLRDQFTANTPYDQLASAILKAEGNSVDQGTPVFYMQYRNQPEDATEAITQIFLGVQLQCARCHDHPYEPWKQVDFYGMAAFLSRLEVVTVGKDNQLVKYALGEKNSGDLLFTGPAKDQKPGQKGSPVKPKFLLGDALVEPTLPADYKEVKFVANQQPPAPQFSRKDQLATWVTKADNPFFARAIVNRLWAQFLGRGLVHPVDNMSPANVPSHPELLDELARRFVQQKFDVKGLIRELVNCRTYQLSSRAESSEQFPRWFESARIRPLSAEELAESWRTAAWYDAAVPPTKEKGPPSRFRPHQREYLIRFFGQPNTGTGDFQGGLHEHLYLNNGPVMSVLVETSGGLVASLIRKETPLEERIELLYVSMLNRKPSDAEREQFTTLLKTNDNVATWRDAAWALMTSGEFRFNH